MKKKLLIIIAALVLAVLGLKAQIITYTFDRLTIEGEVYVDSTESVFYLDRKSCNIGVTSDYLEWNYLDSFFTNPLDPGKPLKTRFVSIGDETYRITTNRSEHSIYRAIYLEGTPTKILSIEIEPTHGFEPTVRFEHSKDVEVGISNRHKITRLNGDLVVMDIPEN